MPRLFLFFLAILSASLPAAAADVEIAEVAVGVSGAWKVGFWVPVTVRLESDRDLQVRVEIVAPDGEGTAVVFADPQLRELPAGGAAIARLAKIGRLSGELAVRVVDPQGAELAAQRISLSGRKGLPSEQQIMLTLGADPGLDDASIRRKLKHLLRHPVADPREMPDRAEALSWVETLVVTTADGAALRLHDRQVEAINQWVQMGGHLVLASAQRAESLLAADSPWAKVVPGTLQAVVEGRQGGGIERLAGAQERLPSFRHSQLRVTGGNADVMAAIDSPEGDLPTIVRGPVGFGLVTFAGLDLDRPPFVRWSGREQLLVELLRRPGEPDDGETMVRGKVRHVGYDDLSGQVRSALDQFDSREDGAGGVQMLSFSIVIVMLAGYVLLLGPGDFLLLRRLRRPAWTWVTFPLLVAVTCGLLVWIRSQLKSDAVLMNRLDVVDLDLPGGVVRGTHWSQLYSPTTASRSVTASARPAIGNLDGGRLLLSWQGLPGTGLGGMQSPTAVGALDGRYRIALQEPEIAGLPMRTASTRSLGARWASRRSGQPASELIDRDGVLRGTLTSPLSTDLSDCVLFYGTWAHLFDGGRLAAGERVAIRGLLRREIEWRLTDKRIVKSQTTFTMTPWDTASRQIPRIVEMLMFHQAAGGGEYTRLQHRYQGYLDLTSHIELGRAVLVGRSRRPATDVQVDGRTPPGDHWTFYRVVYPVAPARKSVP